MTFFRRHYVRVEVKCAQLEPSKYCLMLILTYVSARWSTVKVKSNYSKLNFFILKPTQCSLKCSDAVTTTYLLFKVG